MQIKYHKRNFIVCFSLSIIKIIFLLLAQVVVIYKKIFPEKVYIKALSSFYKGFITVKTGSNFYCLKKKEFEINFKGFFRFLSISLTAIKQK